MIYTIIIALLAIFLLCAFWWLYVILAGQKAATEIYNNLYHFQQYLLPRGYSLYVIPIWDSNPTELEFSLLEGANAGLPARKMLRCLKTAQRLGGFEASEYLHNLLLDCIKVQDQHNRPCFKKRKENLA